MKILMAFVVLCSSSAVLADAKWQHQIVGAAAETKTLRAPDGTIISVKVNATGSDIKQEANTGTAGNVAVKQEDAWSLNYHTNYPGMVEP